MKKLHFSSFVENLREFAESLVYFSKEEREENDTMSRFSQRFYTNSGHRYNTCIRYCPTFTGDPYARVNESDIRN